MLLYIHPTIQGLTILLSLYVLFLGIQRFRFLHLGRKTKFLWKRHVNLGIIVVIGWLSGVIGGPIMARIHWYGFFITGIHWKIGMTILLLALFALGTGLYMNCRKKHSKQLVLIHGLANFILIGLALSQIYTGWRVINEFVLGN